MQSNPSNQKVMSDMLRGWRIQVDWFTALSVPTTFGNTWPSYMNGSKPEICVEITE